MAAQRFYCGASGLLLLSRPLDRGGASTDFSRETVRRVLAGGLLLDLVCDKLDRRTLESCHEQVVG